MFVYVRKKTHVHDPGINLLSVFTSFSFAKFCAEGFIQLFQFVWFVV